MDLKLLINEIPDFPKPGILFRDIGPLLRTPEAWDYTINAIWKPFENLKPDIIVGIEARGFIIGASIATKKEIGFVPVRKAGKLPGNTLREDYQLEYGNDTLEIYSEAFSKQSRVLIVDDLLATGGTAKATANLINKAGGEILGFAFIVELEALSGRKNLPIESKVHSVVHYS